MITDEKMAAHLNGLHISDNIEHDTNKLSTDSNALHSSYSCSIEDIEEKLKRAQRITVSDVVREIQDEPLLPAAIIERFEKASKALVVWKPPQRIVDLIVPKATEKDTINDDDDDDAENNNNNQIDIVEAEMDEAQMDMDNEMNDID